MLKRLLGVGIILLLGAGVGIACTGTASAKTSSQNAGSKVTEEYATKLTAAEPYPISQMNDSAERANLRERLVRLNDPHKIGYLYGLSSTGQVMAFWTVKGKPSSPGSQLTVTQQTVGCYNGCGAVVDSMGDDGSYGPEECQSQGIFAFTADTNALVEWCGPWFYSDAPIKLATAPVIVVDPSIKPTSDLGLNNK